MAATKIARAIEDSFEFQAFSSDYIANILQRRERFSPQPGPLHLTRRQDLLEVELEQPDLSVYEGSDSRILPATRAIIERKHRGGFDLMKPRLLHPPLTTSIMIINERIERYVDACPAAIAARAGTLRPSNRQLP